MFRFLRKHSTLLLAFFGSLLMIMFLVPQAIQNFAERAARSSGVWATVGPDKDDVGSDERELAQEDLELFRNLGMPIGIFGSLEDPAHWFLLVREAEAAGLIGGRGSEQVSPALYQRLTQSPGFRLSDRSEASIARWRGVGRLMELYIEANELSDRRLRAIADRLFYSVDARMVVIEAKVRDDAPDPTAAQMQAHFDAWADTEPGAGDHGFGYRQPDRFKLETLTITDADIRAMIEASDALNGIALYEHWEDNQATNASFPAITDGAAVPAVVRADLLTSLTAKKRGEIEKFINRALHENRAEARLKQDLSGYQTLTETWAADRIAFTELAARLEAEYGISRPAYAAFGDHWIGAEDLGTDSELATIASASTDHYGNRVSVPMLLSGMQELQANPTFTTQAGLAMPPVRTADGGIMLLRATDVDPARAARDIDEVRDVMVENLKRYNDYERLLSGQDQLLATARQDGLLSVALANEASVNNRTAVYRYQGQMVDFALQNNFPIFDQPAPLPVIGGHKETIDALIELARALPRDSLIGALPLADRLVLVPAEDKMALVVAEFTVQQPMTADLYQRLAPTMQLPILVQNEQFGDFGEEMLNCFSFDTLATRYEFVVKRRADDESADDGETADDAADDETTDDEATADATTTE